jgi:hypothetical protein
VAGLESDKQTTSWPILQAETFRSSARLRFQDRAECGNNSRKKIEGK